MFSRISNIFIVCIMLIAFGGVLQATAATEEEMIAARQGMIDVEANKAFMLRYLDAVSGKDKPIELLDKYIAHEKFKQLILAAEAAFPRYKFEPEDMIEDMIFEGDKVAMRSTMRGTHAATGTQITRTFIIIFRIADDKIVEYWLNADDIGLMEQLGEIPATREDYTWGEPSQVTGAPGDPEANKAMVIRNVDEFWNQQNPDVLDELMNPDVVDHGPTGLTVGLEAEKQTMTTYVTAFPELHVTIDDLIAEGDKVAKRWTCTGTHLGEFAGVPASGNQVTFTGITIYRIADGKVVETWWSADMLGLLQQLR